MQELKTGTRLQGGRYTIERTLGQGGFGITYLGVQSGLHREVAIKEFFMKDYCGRDASASQVTLGTEGSRQLVARFREKFLKEARNIAELDHPNIVPIYDVFEENGTAYYVMKYATGGSLASKVKREGHLQEDEATEYILQVASALYYIHQRKMAHLDVKPANIMLDQNGNALLIDFGISKQYDGLTGEQTSTNQVGISPGFSPMEQYEAGGVGRFSPESDIYSLGATFYCLLTGYVPPSAAEVLNNGLPMSRLHTLGVSQRAIHVIRSAMEPRRMDRMKSVDVFFDELQSNDISTDVGESSPYADEATRVAPKAESKAQDGHENTTVKRKAKPKAQSTSPKTTKQKKGNKLTWWVVAIVIIAVIWCGRSLLNMGKADEQQQVVASDKASFSNGVLKVDGVTYDMVLVKAGTFTMGATPEMQNPDVVEKPAHEVTLTKDYYIGKTEVTQALWRAIMGTSEFKGDNLPVDSVSWDDCQQFIKKLNALTGKSFRLPTEAEWEFAARGGNQSRHFQYSGSNSLTNVAWYKDNSNVKISNHQDLTGFLARLPNFYRLNKSLEAISKRAKAMNNDIEKRFASMTITEIHPVRIKQPNEIGLYDMSGNVWEWCNDWYDSYSSDAQTDPKGPSNGSGRVLRGGSCGDKARYCRSSFRDHCAPDGRRSFLGLRLVLSE